jgi:hypothetical protein
MVSIGFINGPREDEVSGLGEYASRQPDARRVG